MKEETYREVNWDKDDQESGSEPDKLFSFKYLWGIRNSENMSKYAQSSEIGQSSPGPWHFSAELIWVE